MDHRGADAPSARGDVLVSVSNASKSYETPAGGVSALRNVHLRVERGECVAVVGPSGSGKSTLLGVIGGLVRPDTGDVIVCDFRWSSLKDAARASGRRRSIAFIHQGLNLVGFMTVLENVMLPLLLNGASASSAREDSRDALQRLGLGGTEERRPRELSGGQQQRVAIARAMAAGQVLVLADEPTGALDTDTSRTVFAAIRAHAHERGAAVVVSHDPLATEYADRTVKISDGAVVA